MLCCNADMIFILSNGMRLRWTGCAGLSCQKAVISAFFRRSGKTPVKSIRIGPGRSCWRRQPFTSTCRRQVLWALNSTKTKILCRSPMSPGVDVSYYLDGGASGVLNAFEEYTVRKLTDKIVNGDAPENLGIFFDQEFDL